VAAERFGELRGVDRVGDEVGTGADGDRGGDQQAASGTIRRLRERAAVRVVVFSFMVPSRG
jgi:hypothetical protein